MSTSTHSGEIDQYENISRQLQTFPFILISRTRRLVGMKGLSGALKRTYCYIPAPATATSPGFPVYNNRQLILLNPPSTYLWRTRHFVYRSCWIKWPISVNLCPFNAVGVYKTINLPFFSDTNQDNTKQILGVLNDHHSYIGILIHFFFFF